MKKGISLIVLVITIIVMIIIAGAIIISLNGTNVVNRANEAVTASDVANLRSALTLEYAEIMAANHDNKTDNDVNQAAADTRYQNVFKTFTVLAATGSGYSVTTNTDLTFTLNVPASAQ